MSEAAVSGSPLSGRFSRRLIEGALCAILIVVVAGRLDWEVVWTNRSLLLRGAINSWLFAMGSILIGALLGTILAASRVYAPIPVRYLIAALIEIIRATPQLIIILGTFFVLPELIGLALDPNLSALIALTVIASAYLAEVVRAGLHSVPRIQYETGYTTGLSPSQIFCSITLPQALRNMVPALIATFVMMFKTTTLVYVIGVTEFFEASSIVNSREHAPYTIYALLGAYYFLCCYLLSSFLRWIDPKYTLQN